MEYIKVDGKLYDPYYILGVARDDGNEQILQAFRNRVRKFHPDKCRKPEEKDKYETLFRVIMKSYEYINKKRKLKDDNTVEYKYADDTFRPLLDNPGYGNYNRLDDIKQYDDFDIEIDNQFKDKKFCNKEFNKKFEYIKNKRKSEDKGSLVIHKTTDGFYGSNSGDISNCALVSTFNGLMITRDNNGVYMGDGYSDYKLAHDAPQNPEGVVLVPNTFLLESEKPIKPKPLKRETINIPRLNFEEQLQMLHQKNLKRLKNEVEQDKTFVSTLSHVYNKDIVQDAIDGRLDKSNSYIEHLDEHYKCKRIGQ